MFLDRRISNTFLVVYIGPQFFSKMLMYVCVVISLIELILCMILVWAYFLPVDIQLYKHHLNMKYHLPLK